MIELTKPFWIVYELRRLEHFDLFHIGNWRTNDIRDLTALAWYRMIMDRRVTPFYCVIARVDLVIQPGGIQHITLMSLLTYSSRTNFYGV